MNDRRPTRGVGYVVVVTSPIVLLLVWAVGFPAFGVHDGIYYSVPELIALPFGIWILARIPSTKRQPVPGDESFNSAPADRPVTGLVGGLLLRGLMSYRLSADRGGR
jgi:hypothetical protein